METQTGRLGDESKEGMNPSGKVIYVKRIIRHDPKLPLPTYKTNGSIGMDLHARLNDCANGVLYIEPDEEALIPMNVVVKCPSDWAPFIFPRSSLYKNYGLILTNSVGVIDFDYCGEKDEIMISVKNISDATCAVLHGDRLAQLVFLRPGIMEVREVESMAEASRGGFGSTGR